MTAILLAITLAILTTMWITTGTGGSQQCQIVAERNSWSQGYGNAPGEHGHVTPGTHAIPDDTTPPPSIGAFFFSMM